MLILLLISFQGTDETDSVRVVCSASKAAATSDLGRVHEIARMLRYDLTKLVTLNEDEYQAS